MNAFRVVTVGTLALSLVANGWLGVHVYKQSKILQLQTASYDTFKLYLKSAVKYTDDLKDDPPGSKEQQSDASEANFELAGAIGAIWGLRTDLAKKGMDIFPIWAVLMQSENFPAYSSDFTKKETTQVIDKNSETLHTVYSTLASTSFSNAGLRKLQQAVTKLDEIYPGYPSYSKLQ